MLPAAANTVHHLPPLLREHDIAPADESNTADNDALLLRLFIKTSEYIYVRPNDILLIESADHLVKVHLGCGTVIKKAFRHSTLKALLAQLPAAYFMRISRFYAINTQRLSGGNSKQQTFEFEFLFHNKSCTLFTQFSLCWNWQIGILSAYVIYRCVRVADTLLYGISLASLNAKQDFCNNNFKVCITYITVYFYKAYHFI